MPENPSSWLYPGFKSHLYLLIPLASALGMAWKDLRVRRIPNYLTFTTALAGLGFQWGAFGWQGFVQGLLGLALGLALLLPFYLAGGLGAGDVKALAALGAWLGPWPTLLLFIYMGLAGLPLLLVFLWYRGELPSFLRKIGRSLKSWLLFQGRISLGETRPNLAREGVPYAVALALGMATLCFRGW